MPRAKGGSIPPPRVNVQPGQWGPISTLNQHDVLSGRGGRINNHPGNIAFRTIVEDYKHEYLDPRTRKLEKAHVAARLVAQIRSTNPPGRFLREDPDNAGMYVEIGDQKAWKKAGQALREDAPDVRKEIDEHLVTTDKPVKLRPTPPPPPHQQQQQQQPPYLQHQHQQHPHQRPRLPPGIPPSVSYSPTSAPMPLAPPSSGGGGPRPDPPEAVGVTGYRQRPLVYRTNAESGRGGRSIAGGRAFPPGRGGGGGRGPPPSPHHNPQQQQQHPGAHPPPQGGYHHQNYYNHPPPPPPQAMAQHQPPHAQHYSQPPPPGGPQFQHDKFQHDNKFQQQAPHSGPPQYQQHYQQHPHQYPPNQPPPQPGYGQQPPQPQFTAQDGKHGKNRKAPMNVVPPIIGAVAHGVHNTMESLSGLTNRVVKVGRRTVPNRESTTSEFPPHMSVATDFTMSDISTFGKLTDSNQTTPLDRNDTVGTFDASMKMSTQSDPPLGRSALLGVFDESTGALVPTKAEEDGPQEYRDHEVAVSGDDEKPPKGETEGTNGGAPAKQSTNTSSSDENKSFTMSDLMGSGFSLGLSGRTRSFPDLMLSTGAIFPPLQNDSDREEKDQTRNSSSSSNRDGVLLHPFHRQSSSESSGNMGGFHPVRRRSITGNNPNVLNLNDAMSIMSLDSRKSIRSENSSWLENFRSMQSIHSDMNPWEAGTSGRNSSRRNNDMINDGTDGSMGSLLSDVTPELNALDLAEPLLPPIDSDHNMNDCHDFMGMRRPDP